MRSIPAIFLLLLFLSGCYNSPSQVQSHNSTQPASAPTTEIKADENDDQEAMEEKAPDESNSDEAILADALKQVESGTALLVDVRRDEEWEEAHFESARHIPLASIDENPESAFAEIDKQQTVFIH